MGPIVGIGFGPGATIAYVVTLGFGVAVPGVIPMREPILFTIAREPILFTIAREPILFTEPE
jgi:hypothetical protein